MCDFLWWLDNGLGNLGFYGGVLGEEFHNIMMSILNLFGCIC
jgi:hypothetical protein